MIWFAPLGLIWRPISVAGWIVTGLALAFCVNVFLAVDAHTHSNTDTLNGVFPFWAPTFLLWAYVAGKTTRRPAA